MYGWSRERDFRESESSKLKVASSRFKVLGGQKFRACGSHRLCMGGCSSYCGPQSIVDQACLSGYLKEESWVSQVSKVTIRV